MGLVPRVLFTFNSDCYWLLINKYRTGEGIMTSINITTDYEHFKNLRGAWETLRDKLGNNTSVFTSALWYETWWQHFSDGAILNLLTMWEADKLVGIAPLMIKQTTIHGLPVRAIGFVENRNSLHNDFVVLPAYREVFLREALRTIFEQSHQWDVIVINNLPETSPNYSLVIKILGETGRKWQQDPTFNSPYLTLSGSWADYLASRSSRTRKSLRNIQNGMHKAGEVSVRNIQTWEEYQQVKEDLYHVAKQSWTDEIGDSLATPVNEAFFDDLACSAAAQGWLSVWTLYLNGTMIAFEFHLKDCGKDYAMRGSYMPEFSHLSPGTYLEMQILKNAFEAPEQVEKYDFGGSFDSYKRKWTDNATPHCELLIFNDGIYSRFIVFHEMRTVPLLKRFRDKIKRNLFSTYTKNNSYRDKRGEGGEGDKSL